MLCPLYQESDPQVIKRQCHQINSYRMEHCFPGNRERKRSRRIGVDRVIKRGEREEGEFKGESDKVD